MATSQTPPLTDEQPTLASRPSVLLAILGEHAMQRTREALGEYGLKPRQLEILELLAREGEVGQRELGDTLKIDHSILVTMLNPMESEGLVERRRSCTDRRRHIVSLTDAGRDRFAQASASIDRAEEQLLGILPADDLRQLSELLARLGAAAGVPHGEACDAV
jgi:DNA-binding MarR family transcriptional regulator